MRDNVGGAQLMRLNVRQHGAPSVEGTHVSRSGSGVLFDTHPILWVISLGAAALAGLLFASYAVRSRGWRQLGWGALVISQTVQVVGIVGQRPRSV